MLRLAALYLAVVLAAVAVFFLIQSYGNNLSAPVPATAQATGPSAKSSDVLYHLLLALAAVVAVGRLLNPLFKWIGQPPVIGEVIGGILLGPSLLGLVAPNVYRYVLPPDVAPYLGMV